MKSYKIGWSIFLLGLIVQLLSCKKFLDQEPVSNPTDPTSWKSDNDANAQVAGCYSLIRTSLNSSNRFFVYGDLPTDFWGTIVDNNNYISINQLNWAISVPPLNTSDTRLQLRVWAPFYSSIQQSNRCIYFLQQMPDNAFMGASASDLQARRNKYIAEAKFCRAFNYFYMSRVWGDVPLDTTYQSDISGITSDPRLAQQNVLQSAINDLNFAKQWLPYRDASSSDQVVRADKGSVFALLAHIYAWKGSYDSCKMACDSVIMQGGYTLVPGSSYADIYKGQSSEGIFEIAQNQTAESMNASFGIAGYTLAAPYLPNVTIPNWQINTSLFGHLFSDTTDARYTSGFVYVNSGSAKYYFCKKYSNISTISANNVKYYLSKNNIIVFRLADIYLLRAEAGVAANSPNYNNALVDLNTVRSRAGIKTLQSSDIVSKTAFLDTITAERGRELFLEGSRFYDLVRNERLTGVSHFPYINHSDFLKGKYYWPIDPSLMILNAGLKQTPFWQQLLTY